VSGGNTEIGANHGGADDRATRLERQLATAQQITHIGSWEWDLATHAITWSDELYRIYGFAPQSCEVTFERFLSMLHPADRERVQAEVQRALTHGSRFAYPERIVRPDGSVRNLDTIGEVLTNGDGRVVGLIGTCRDVTESLKRDEMLRLYADIGQCIQIGLSAWQVEDPARPELATLVALNAAAELIGGVSHVGATGKTITEIFPAVAGTELLEMLSEVARDRVTRELADYRLAGSADDPRTFAVKAFPLPGCCVGFAFEDVTVQTRARRLQAAEQRVLELIASGVALEQILTTLVLLIEEQAPPTIGSILLLDDTGARVRHGAAPHLPAEYNRAIDGAPIGPTAGSCGSAMLLKRAVIVTDIETDPRWDSYRNLARRFGLRACWSMPIFASDDRVLGSFALYYREPRSPSAAELDLIARATHIAGIAIQRQHLDDRLRALSARIERVREEERTGIAREIHDSLGQALTALKMDIAWVARRLGAGLAASVPSVLEKLDGMSRLTDEIIEQVRRISTELRPGVLDDLGLLAAIEWQSQEFEQRTGTTCIVQSNLGSVQLDRNVSTALFRIFQEALTNVARHAQASHVDVRLDQTDGCVRLVVHDDGVGIAREALARPTSLGLLGMHERARHMGGTLGVSGEAGGGGTLVVVELPHAGGQAP